MTLEDILVAAGNARSAFWLCVQSLSLTVNEIDRILHQTLLAENQTSILGQNPQYEVTPHPSAMNMAGKTTSSFPIITGRVRCNGSFTYRWVSLAR